MSLQLYQVDNKSYLLDFKSLSPHVDDTKVPVGMTASLNDSMGKTVFHESFNNTQSEMALKKRSSGKS